MSKAFVKESDSEADLPYEPPAIPAGIKNYMTPRGHRQMQDELHQLLRVERLKVVEAVTWAAGNGDRSENGDYIYSKRRLREVDRRIRFLSTRLESAEVVDPKQPRWWTRNSRRSWTRSFSARPLPMPTSAGTYRPSQSSVSTRPISVAVR